MAVKTLKPEVEFELYKLVLLRESYLQRLMKKVKSNKGTVDIGLIGMFDVLREVSIEVVDTIRMWERSQIDYPDVKPFLWNGSNYLEKMVNDLEYLEKYPQIASWLGFSLTFNPFIVPPDVLVGDVHLEPGSFVVFGRRPDRYLVKTEKEEKPKFFKSPYTTPIINDPEVFAHLSVKKQLERKFKAAASAVLKNRRETEASGATTNSDPFESFLSFDLVHKIRHCWKILHTANSTSLEESNSFFQSTFLPTDSVAMDGKHDAQLHVDRDLKSDLQQDVDFSDSFATMPHGGKADLFHQNSELPQQAASFAESSVVTRAGEERHDCDGFRRNKSHFYRSLQESSGVNYHLMDARNKALRMSQVSQKSVDGSSTVLAQSQVWTPHEIHMQRQVQRRGGELYVLTAAGTKGRMKAPWRRTRFERLETDLAHMVQQSNALGMAIEDDSARLLLNVPPKTVDVSEPLAAQEEEMVVKLKSQVAALVESKKDVDLRLGALSYQHSHFKMVAEGGNLTDIEKQRRLHQLQDGQTLEGDEKASMSLEDLMAFRIQRRVRRAFGRALRKALLLKKNKAAMVIQGMWRRAQVHMLSANRGKQLRLATILQRLYRGSMVSETMRTLKREAEERRASLNIQRAFRGYLGRQRLSLKREFVKSLDEAQKCVALRALAPGDIEELADAIELFVRDYTLDLTPAVLTVLRGVLYMFNGENAECVNVSNGGYTEKKYIRAAVATWHGVKLILRRKGRLLRRLRALIHNSRLPNPSSLKFSADCAEHLSELVKGVSEEDFEDMGRGKHCVIQLFHYCRHLKRAFDLQELFPEYFDPGQPGWFRILMKLRSSFDHADLKRRIESKCKFRLEEHKRTYARDGRSWKPVGDAVKRNEFLLEEAKALRVKTKTKYQAYVTTLVASEQKRVATLQGIERSRALGVEVAVGDLKEYLRHCFIPDEAALKELHYMVDTKTIALLQTRADVVHAVEGNERNEASRDFDKIMRPKKMHDKCAELGVIIADLMVLLNRWKTLIKSIGGFQYVKDLVGAKKETFERIKAQALSLMEQRRVGQLELEQELQDQYAKVARVSHDAGMKMIHQYWDLPTHVEVSAEDEENRECCRRDADFELRQKRQTAFVSIPDAPFYPVLVLVDARIPRNLRQIIVDTLCQFDFILCSASQSDPNLFNIFQAAIDQRKSLIFFANRGSHQIARLSFMTMFNSLLAGLIPRPRVVGVDCSADLHVEDWHSIFAVDQGAVSQSDINQSVQCDFSVGKVRKIAHKFRSLLLAKRCMDSEPSFMPRWVKSEFQRDFSSFKDSLLSQRLTGLALGSLSPEKYADIVLAATLACVFEFWQAPLTEWKEEDVLTGCRYFRIRCKKLSNFELCNLLSLKKPLNTETVASRRVNQSAHLSRAWSHLRSLDFHHFPARYLLTSWVREITDLLNWFSSQGGQADGAYKSCEMAFVRHVRWKEDVLFRDDLNPLNRPGEELVGDLLYECLRFSRLYENRDCPVNFYFDRQNLESVEAQSIGVAHTTQHVCVYQCGSESYVSVSVDNEKLKQEGKQIRNWKYFARMPVREILSMLQPNNTEIFEGKVKKYDIRDGVGAFKWFELLAQWACLDNIGEKFQITLLRSRYLILSKLGQSNGYFIRMEIFEERFGEVRILVYGILPNGGAVNFKVDRAVVYDLLLECDAHEEKDKLEALDTQSIAYIFSDRLEVRPSKNWQHFLGSGELPPKSLERPVSVKLRKKRGPGRFVGRQVLKVSSVAVLITIYEIDNETNSHELRVVLYELKQCQTVEYRISPMERLMLFSDDEPLLEQICSRIRHVYCDPSEKTRRLMVMEEGFVPLVVPFEVEGDDEYDICSLIDEDESTAQEDEEDPEQQSSSSSREDSGSYGFDEDDQSLQSSRRRKKVAPTTDIAEDSLSVHSKIKSNWRWAVYFHRCVVREFKGNLVVSVGLSVSLGGFTVMVLDQRTYYEAYRFVSFVDASPLLEDKPLEALQEELSNLDESVAFDLMDDLMALVEVQDSDEEGLAVVLASADKDVADDVIIARLRSYRSIVPDTLSRKRVGVVMQEIEVNVYAAKDLLRLGNFGSRNPVAVVKWNMREIGRTAIMRSNLNPVWEEEGSTGNSFHTVTVRDQQVRDCTLEVEIHDTETKGALTDFLGCVKFNGAALVKFLERGIQRQWLDLGKSKRLSDAENRAVKGSVEISGRKWDHVNRFSVKASPALVAPKEVKDVSERSDNRSVVSDLDSPAALVSHKQPSQPVLFARGHSNKGAPQAYSKPPPPMWERTATTTALGSSDAKGSYGAAAATHKELSPPEHFEVSVVAAENLPSACEVVCVVRFDGAEVARLKATTSVANYLQAVAEFADAPLKFTTPLGFPIGGCSLEVEVLRADLKESFGVLSLRGTTLRTAVNSTATNLPEWFPLQTAGGSPPAPSAPSNESPRVMLYASRQPIVQKQFELSVLGAHNIAKADTFGKSDPYVKVFFNGRLVGRTKTISNTLNPDWEGKEVFPLTVPVGRAVEECRLEVQIYDHDAISDDDFLGCRVVAGRDLVALLTHSKGGADTWGETARQTSRGVAYQLHRSTDLAIDQSLAVRGEIELSGAVVTAATGSAQEAEAQSRQSVRKASVQRADVSGESLPLLEHVQNQETATVLLNVVAATNLAKADTFGKSDPFVIVSFNGRVVGQTRVIKNTLDPVWGANEVFEFAVPRGHTLAGCRVDLEVFDADNLSQGDFLGTVAIDGAAMVTQGSKIANKAHVTPFGEGLRFTLQPSERRTAKENSIVKGGLEVRFAFRGPTAGGKPAKDVISMNSKLPKTQFSIAALHGLDLSALPAVGSAAEVPLSLVALWNGHEVSRMLGIWHRNNKHVLFSQTESSFPVYIPGAGEYGVGDCFLQLALEHGGTRVTHVLLHGEQLAAVRADPSKAGMWCPLAPLANGSSSSGRVHVVCTAADPLLTVKVVEEHVPHEYTGGAGMRGPIENKSYPLIRTELTESDTNWRYHFPGAEELRPKVLPKEEEEAEEKEVDGKAQVTNTAAVSALVRGQERGTVAGDRRDQADKRSSVMVLPQNLLAAVASRAKLTPKMQLELAAMNFTVTVREILDDHRTCWRGRVMPKNFIAPDATAKKAIMMTRSSRLIKMKNIRDMQVLAEVHYLSDLGDEEAVSDLLPISVKEIVSDGPGVVKRLYRVEVSANNGILMGTADIKDEEGDIRRLVGPDCPPGLLEGKKKTWKLGAIFEHVVRERLILDMMPAGNRKGAKEGRRDGVVARKDSLAQQQHEHEVDSMDVSGSLITLIRDPLPGQQLEYLQPVLEGDDQESLASGFIVDEPQVGSTGDFLGSAAPASTIGSADGEAQESMVDTDRSVASAERKVNWMRIHTRTHRLTGKTFLSLVILQSAHKVFGESPEYFFKTYDGAFCLCELTVLFRCKDSWTKAVHDLLIPGDEILDWLPSDYNLDLTTKFRRDKFGAYLLQFLCLRFREDGDYELYLIKEDAHTQETDLLSEKEEPAADDIRRMSTRTEQNLNELSRMRTESKMSATGGRRNSQSSNVSFQQGAATGLDRSDSGLPPNTARRESRANAVRRNSNVGGVGMEREDSMGGAVPNTGRRGSRVSTLRRNSQDSGVLSSQSSYKYLQKDH